MKKHKIHGHYNSTNRVTLYYGDCLKLLRTLKDKSVQLIVTSPPYNIGKPYERKAEIDYYLNKHKRVILECKRVLKSTGSICWQVGNYTMRKARGKGSIIPLDTIFYPIFVSIGFQLRNRIIWHFGHGLHGKHRLSGRYETVSWFTLTDDYIFNLDDVRVKQIYRGKRAYQGPNRGNPSGNVKGKNPSDFWDETILSEMMEDVWKNIPNVKGKHVEKTDHPCQYPIALVRRLIRMLSNRNHLVLDPYTGTGSTLIGSLIEGRRAAGAENNADYYKIALSRLHLHFQEKLRYRPDRPVLAPNTKHKVAREPQEWS